MKPPEVPPELIDAAGLGVGATWSWLAGLGGGAWRVERAHAPDVVVRPATDVEQRAAGAAADVGVGPTVVAMADGWLVVEYLRGAHLTTLELSRPPIVSELARVLRRMHSSDVHLPEVELAGARHRYLEQLDTSSLPGSLLSFAAEADEVERRLVSDGVTPVPAHLDVAANVLATPSGLRLIDCEYAGAAEPARELGQVIWEAQMDPTNVERLVSAYGPREGVSERSTREWAWITGVTWTLWAFCRAGDHSTRCYARRSWEQMNTFWARPTP